MKKRESVLKSLLRVTLRSLTIYVLAKKMWVLLKVDAEKAGKSLVIMMTLVFFLVALVMMTWACVLALFYLLLIGWHLSVLMSLSLLLLLNAVGVMVFAAGLCRLKNKWLSRMGSVYLEP